MSDIWTKNAGKYERLLRSGVKDERLANVMIEDERDELKRAEREIDPQDRARIMRAVEYGAKELGVPTPRVRFFSSKSFDFGGITYRDYANEIWVAADRPLHEQARLALHELAHVEHIAHGIPRELRERDAERFAYRARHWV